MEVNILNLVGQVFTRVERDTDSLTFYKGDELVFELAHHQDCCENVTLEDVIGDLHDLENSVILQAEEAVNHDHEDNESCTWTFYKLATIKGYVTLRWYGESNGYYSEDARCYYCGKDKNYTPVFDLNGRTDEEIENDSTWCI